MAGLVNLLYHSTRLINCVIISDSWLPKIHGGDQFPMVPYNTWWSLTIHLLATVLMQYSDYIAKVPGKVFGSIR